MNVVSKNCPTSDTVINMSGNMVKSMNESIPVRITQRNNFVRKNVKVEHSVNLVNIEINECIPAVQPHFNKQPQTYDIPSILTTNVRAIGNKIDEIQLVAELNSVGGICITETWLSSTVPDSNITIPSFNLFRKDRTGTSGGGVCIYLKNTIPSKYLDYCDQSGVESLWV